MARGKVACWVKIKENRHNYFRFVVTFGGKCLPLEGWNRNDYEQAKADFLAFAKQALKPNSWRWVK